MIKLLIADDEPLVLVGLKSMINWDEFGISICGTARNGEQALEIIEKERPQLVIADIKMPLKNGFEVMEECRQKFNPGPLFIILTSFEEREFLRKAITLSAIEYLIKVELTPQSLSEAHIFRHSGCLRSPVFQCTFRPCAGCVRSIRGSECCLRYI